MREGSKAERKKKKKKGLQQGGNKLRGIKVRKARKQTEGQEY